MGRRAGGRGGEASHGVVQRLGQGGVAVKVGNGFERMRSNP